MSDADVFRRPLIRPAQLVGHMAERQEVFATLYRMTCEMTKSTPSVMGILQQMLWTPEDPGTWYSTLLLARHVRAEWDGLSCDDVHSVTFRSHEHVLRVQFRLIPKGAIDVVGWVYSPSVAALVVKYNQTVGNKAA